VKIVVRSGSVGCEVIEHGNTFAWTFAVVSRC
jgi:hypothetical protein